MIPESFVDTQGSETIPDGALPEADGETPYTESSTAEPERIGSFTWEYTVDDSVIEQLGEGEQLVEEFLITITDLLGTDDTTPAGSTDTITVTVTVTGTNDQPVFVETDDDPESQIIERSYTEAELDSLTDRSGSGQ